MLPTFVRSNRILTVRHHLALRKGASSFSTKAAADVGRPQASRLVTPLILASMTAGFVAGRSSLPVQEHDKDHDHNHLVLPDGYPRTCCDELELTEDQTKLSKAIESIVGKENVLDGRVETTTTSQFLKGARLGRGSALCIVRPNDLNQLVDVVQAAVDADCVVLTQGSNTGLTGGSVPRENADHRPTVLVSMKNFDTIFPIDNGERVVCLAGAGLATLQKFAKSECGGRESHSILGSTFLNPSVAAGVALSSGGTQIRKGPAFTERALYLKVVEDKATGKKQVKIINTLGVEGLDQQEGESDGQTMNQKGGVISTLSSHAKKYAEGGSSAAPALSSNKTYGQDPASDVDYKNRLCEHNHEVSRCNSDTRGRECNRSEGKVMILASVHDTFESPKKTRTFWVSFDSLNSALQFRKDVCLNNPKDLPVSVEYMDRDSFDVIDRSGRILGHTIKWAGTSSTVVRDMWKVKLYIEALPIRGSATFPDKLLHFANNLVPSILPSDIMDVGRKMDHHLAITVGDYDGSLDRFMKRMDALQEEKGEDNMKVRECTDPSELSGLTAFRFVAAPAFRTWCVGEGVQGFSVDYALPKNAGSAPPIPSEAQPLKRMRYSHFACNVVHEDVAFAAGVDVEAVKHQLKDSVEHTCHGKLPAEHGHGKEYTAPKATQERWKKMDPTNVMNPGVGGLATTRNYVEDSENVTEETSIANDGKSNLSSKTKRTLSINLGPIKSLLRRFKSDKEH